jgi:hypothetical protein
VAIYRYGQIWLRINLTQIWIGFCPPPLKLSLFYIYCVLNLSVPFYLPWLIQSTPSRKILSKFQFKIVLKILIYLPDLFLWLSRTYRNIENSEKNNKKGHLFTLLDSIKFNAKLLSGCLRE